MRTRVAVLTLAIVLASPAEAVAWDPDRVPPVGATTESTRPGDGAPYLAPPPGLHYVTDTYVADVVTTTGPLTIYSTATVHESTGSYARALETVETGASSAFDGTAFNGRASRTDGRAVAGTYYENFVLTAAGFVPVSIVFFQDDSYLWRGPTPTGPTASGPSTTPPAMGEAPASPAPCCAPPRPREITVGEGGERPARIPIRPGVSIAPAGAPLTRIEVLRGKPVALWLRAYAADREIPVRSWALAGGVAGDAEGLSGSGTAPFRTSWNRLAPPGTAYELRFALVADAPTGSRSIEATIAVVVRAPALVE